jgi:signal transduction histidine kinase/phage shock protein PspC (stress-responsive transcriptional regulator)
MDVPVGSDMPSLWLNPIPGRLRIDPDRTLVRTPNRSGSGPDAIGRGIEDDGSVKRTSNAGAGPGLGSALPGPAPRKVYRSTRGRMLGGVAQGMAEHFGVDVWWIRGGFILLAFSGGAGVAAYAAFWALIPLDPDGNLARTGPGGAGLGVQADDSSSRLGPLLALGALAVGVVSLLQHAGAGPAGTFAVPLLVVGLGIAVLWRVADDSQRAQWLRTAASGGRRNAWLRISGGVLLIVAGAVAVVGVGTRGGLGAAINGLAGALVVVAGAAVVLGPWVLRSTRELSEERRERIRSQERAEFAAHVHDSVVQTLTLIQRNADDPKTVARLARAEERSLRQWLYRPGGSDQGMFRAALEAVAAEVEDGHGGTIEVVVVGDAPLDDGLTALVQAAREAMVNAAKYAADCGPVSVYAELEPEQAAVFVRDRGPGFELADIPGDRLGVRQSIIGRMERHGGRAEITSHPGDGAEVRLTMTRSAAPTGSPAGERKPS